jgi:hypothetical protein
MYDTSPHYMFHTLYKKLPDIEVDRGDIRAKLENMYFDAVVYGSIHRCRDHFDLVSRVYPRDKVAFIDGEDGPGIAPVNGCGWYFKRELYEPFEDVLPIQFGVPKEVIRPIDLTRKKSLMAHCDPRDRSTMVYYDSETRYYDQYSDAWFGYTMKKAGWDAMRHHEILAAGCLPYFDGMNECPPLTLARFDRNVFKTARILCNGCSRNGHVNAGDASEIGYLISKLRDNGLLTTEDLARLVLDRVS